MLIVGVLSHGKNKPSPSVMPTSRRKTRRMLLLHHHPAVAVGAALLFVVPMLLNSIILLADAAFILRPPPQQQLSSTSSYSSYSAAPFAATASASSSHPLVWTPSSSSSSALQAANNEQEERDEEEAARLKILSARRQQVRQTLKAAEAVRHLRLRRGLVPALDAETGKPVQSDGKLAVTVTAFGLAAGAIALRVGGRAALVSAVGLDFIAESPELKDNLEQVLTAAETMDPGHQSGAVCRRLDGRQGAVL